MGQRPFLMGLGQQFKNDNLGIGTTSPGKKLHVDGTPGVLFAVGDSSISDPYVYIDTGDSLGAFYTRSNHDLRLGANNDKTMVTIQTDGNVGIGTASPGSWKLNVNGSFRADSKSFEIDHPTRPNMTLVHSCIEGPELAVYYRGEAKLVKGQVVIQLPEYFEGLTRKQGRTVQITPKGTEPYLLSATEVSDGKFKVYGTNPDGEFYWEVKAVRADIEPLKVERPKEQEQG